jgi:hypothetical protein
MHMTVGMPVHGLIKSVSVDLLAAQAQGELPGSTAFRFGVERRL